MGDNPAFYVAGSDVFPVPAAPESSLFGAGVSGGRAVLARYVYRRKVDSFLVEATDEEGRRLTGDDFRDAKDMVEVSEIHTDIPDFLPESLHGQYVDARETYAKEGAEIDVVFHGRSGTYFFFKNPSSSPFPDEANPFTADEDPNFASREVEKDEKKCGICGDMFLFSHTSFTVHAWVGGTSLHCDECYGWRRQQIMDRAGAPSDEKGVLQLFTPPDPAPAADEEPEPMVEWRMPGAVIEKVNR